jgi:hypothetical protein
MIITKKQLANIIKDSLGHVDESLLLYLLAGCKSECNLMSIAPELQNLTFAPCVTQEIYPFETLSWKAGVTISELQTIAQNEGYTFDLRNTLWNGYTQIKITIPNVPSQLVEYLHNTGMFKEKRFLERYEGQLCDVDLYFVRYEMENGTTIVLKNANHLNHLERGDAPDWINEPYSTGTICRDADSQCNEDFMAVVANVNPRLTPDEDTGFEDTGI